MGVNEIHYVDYGISKLNNYHNKVQKERIQIESSDKKNNKYISDYNYEDFLIKKII